MTNDPPEAATTRRLGSWSDLWIFGGWHTALGAGALATDAALRCGRSPRETAAFAALAAGGTLALYGARYTRSARFGGSGERERLLRTREPWGWFFAGAGACSAAAGLVALPSVFAWWTLPWGLLGLAYCFPVIGRPWREYGSVKPFLLALSWTAITGGPPGAEVWPRLFAARLLWMTGLCLAFDMKDVEKDRAAGVRTPAGSWPTWIFLPVVFGVMAAGVACKPMLPGDDRRWPVLAGWVLAALMLARVMRRRTTREWVLWGDGMMVAYALFPEAVFYFF